MGDAIVNFILNHIVYSSIADFVKCCCDKYVMTLEEKQIEPDNLDYSIPECSFQQRFLQFPFVDHDILMPADVDDIILKSPNLTPLVSIRVARNNESGSMLLLIDSDDNLALTSDTTVVKFAAAKPVPDAVISKRDYQIASIAGEATESSSESKSIVQGNIQQSNNFTVILWLLGFCCLLSGVLVKLVKNRYHLLDAIRNTQSRRNSTDRS